MSKFNISPQTNLFKWSSLIFVTTWILFFLYSFSQKDLNLTIYNISLLQPFYNFMIDLGYYHRLLATWLFLIIVIIFFISYLIIIKTISLRFKKFLLVILFLITIFGVFAYPIFSHDIFNYLFNAKMVLVYGKNPHIVTALQFPNDLWTRFMHNTHTPAPYGYGWTITSLLPVLLGLPRFTISFWLMKLMIIMFYFIEGYLFYLLALKFYSQKNALKRLALLIFNPLLLIETFIMGHNDSVMMAPFFLSLYYIFSNQSTKSKFLGIFFWIYSITIKYATVVLAPFILLRKKIDFFTYAGLLMLLVLFSRPDQIHSWYLHWGISLLLLSKQYWAISLAIILSFSGLLRYFPYILYGNWDQPVATYRMIILLLPLLLLIFKPVRNYFKNILIGNEKI